MCAANCQLYVISLDDCRNIREVCNKHVKLFSSSSQCKNNEYKHGNDSSKNVVKVYNLVTAVLHVDACCLCPTFRHRPGTPISTFFTMSRLRYCCHVLPCYYCHTELRLDTALIRNMSGDNFSLPSDMVPGDKEIELSTDLREVSQSPEKAPVPTNAFTIRNLLRHFAKQAFKLVIDKC